ncbi:hypothetical protein EAO70_01420 [Streptomyces sp. adm13(2018)]|uniref:phosphatase n=1 Tax=Streptomyces sp. adm13(2018) TaxID=2479007 RepID=UPI0011CECCE6|nr:phosphatase [Streptomyces sp. adm13(2018)]TXS31592.1 hypothetical protein EAO70_01420 [Streptomyces sp. adm13(2018)]
MLSTGALRAHLLAAGLAGTVATSREESLRSYRLFAARDPRVMLGLDPTGGWGEADLLRLMADKCGVSDDPAHRSGPDVIDPERTLRGLDGCLVLTPAQGRCVDITTRFGVRTYVVDYVRGVALVREPGPSGDGREPGAHSHSPLPVRAALESAAEAGGPLPELVIGDHGWVCGAGQLGIEAIGLADTDDPALFVGEAEGQVSVAVPVDDGVRPAFYRPLTRYVLNRACLSR